MFWLFLFLVAMVALYFGPTHLYKRLRCVVTSHDYENLCPDDVTPFVVCRRCQHSGWVL